MNGIDPFAEMQQIAMKLHGLNASDEIEKALDRIEYLFEVIDPELQDHAEKLISLLREKLAKVQ